MTQSFFSGLTARIPRFAFTCAAFLALPFSMVGSISANEINVYSHRETGLIKPLIDAFEEQSGIKVNVLFAKNGLVERAASEGVNSPVDVILTTDIGLLQSAKAAGVSTTIDDAELLARIPANFRDPDNHWIALSLRARVLYASKDRVSVSSLDYADLANAEWKGRLCTRSGQHVYSIGLIASILAHEGEQATREWLISVRDNLSRRPTGNDRAQVKAVFSGECDLALGNTYYMGLMQTNDKEPEQKEWAKSIRILFPNSDDRGTHVNVSGLVLAKYAPNPENALAFARFLVSDKAQAIYAQTNHEYPVVSSVPPSVLVASWGELNPDQIDLTKIGEQRAAASALVDDIAFDDGPR